jgi:AAA+ ATPase superfamily predicted ATPase
MLVGREEELSTLTLLEKSKKAEVLVLYGRRRVGKSALVQHFCGGKRALLFEAIAERISFPPATKSLATLLAYWLALPPTRIF